MLYNPINRKGGLLEQHELDLINEHRKNNYELDKLYQKHQNLGKQADTLEAIKVLTTAESTKLHKIKKEKLDVRDKLSAILSTL